MDRSVRHAILRAVIRDRTFLKQAWQDVNPDTFPERDEVIIAKAAVDFYEEYQEPIGSFLSAKTDALASTEKFGTEAKKKLKLLRRELQDARQELISVKALVDHVKSLKKHSFYDTAVEEVLTAHEKGEFDASVLEDLVERANKELSADSIQSVNYLGKGSLDKRIEKRSQFDKTRFPLSLIDPLDEKTKRVAGRGHLGMFLAPPNSGKGMALLHLAVSYAAQGANVLFVTLEDPLDEVENRLDAQLTGILINKLELMPNKLRKRWKRARKKLRGGIRILDGTDGGVTVTSVEKAWVRHKREGFTADVIIVDYDDEIECEKKFKGESGRRFEFAEIYRRLRKLAAKLDIIVWTAAQGTRKSEGKRVITMKEVAEDISKIRKAFIAIGIGSYPKDDKKKYLYVLRHKVDRSRFGFDIMSDYARGMFYDREGTMKMRALKRSQLVKN